MWDKKEPNRSGLPQQETPPPRPAPPQGTGKIVNIGQSILVQGELSGSEDLTIDGQVQGKISLRDHNLTIGQHGRIKAELVARTVTIQGKVEGNVIAAEKVDIQQGGRLDGDITAPRISIADGAHFRGKVDMEKGGSSQKSPVVGKTQGATAS